MLRGQYEPARPRWIELAEYRLLEPGPVAAAELAAAWAPLGNNPQLELRICIAQP